MPKVKKTWTDIKSATVLQLCAAHIIKAVQRKTGDKGLQNVTTLAGCKSLFIWMMPLPILDHSAWFFLQDMSLKMSQS